jgi:hypothetical protein
MTPDATSIAAQYGLAGFMALVVGWIGYRIGLRMIKAIDDQAVANREAARELAKEWRDTATAIIRSIDEHTKIDSEYHSEVNEAIIRLESRIDTALDLTPVRPQRRVKTDPEGVRIGQYGPIRPKDRDR